MLLFFYVKCSSDSDCTDDTDANRCESGQCVCGSTGGKCTTTSGKPVCTKSAAFSTAATSADGTSAVCSVSCYFLAFWCFCLYTIIWICDFQPHLAAIYFHISSAKRIHVSQVLRPLELLAFAILQRESASAGQLKTQLVHTAVLYQLVWSPKQELNLL